jgi:hypothetical protein
MKKMKLALLLGFCAISARASITIQADLPWQDSGYAVTAGDTYTITASGLWTGGTSAGFGLNGPAGTTWDPGYNQWVSGPNWGALVASIGYINNTVPPLLPTLPALPNPVPATYAFLTGSSVTFVAGASGDLYFTINDDAEGGDYSDNLGTMTVNVTAPEPGSFAALSGFAALLVGLRRSFPKLS